MTARMSSELRILYSLPSSLISVPPYLLTSTRSPFLTSKATFLPLSSVLPVPSATMMPSVGFSLALSGMIMPPFLTSFSSAGSTRTRSPRGLTLIAIMFYWFVCLIWFWLNQIPPHLQREKDGLAKTQTHRAPVNREAKLSGLLLVHHFGVDDRLFLAALSFCASARPALGAATARLGLFRRGLVKLG